MLGCAVFFNKGQSMDGLEMLFKFQIPPSGHELDAKNTSVLAELTGIKEGD